MGCISSKSSPAVGDGVHATPGADRSGIEADPMASAGAAVVAAKARAGAAASAGEGPDAASSPVAEPIAVAASHSTANRDLRQDPGLVPAESERPNDTQSVSKWITVFDPNEPFADPTEAKEVPVVDLKMAMEQVGDDKAFLLELITDMLNEKEKQIQELNEAMTTNDVTKCRMIAHTIKGSSVNVGLKSLSRRAKIIERFCDSILEGRTHESLHAKADPYVMLIREEYAKIELFKNERLE